MNKAFAELSDLVGELSDLSNAVSVLSWDQQTYMPPRGSSARGTQMATLSAVIHEKLILPQFDDLLEQLSGNNGLSEDQRAYIREFKWSRDRQKKLPTTLVKELAKAESDGFVAWERARQKKDYSLFAPELRRLVDLNRQKADCFGWEETPWDALVQDFERGMTAARVREIFTPLREETVALLDKVKGAEQPGDRFLDQLWPRDAQWEFANRIARDLGYDFESGRQDISSHPFTTSFSIQDVRITTRVKETELFNALFSTIHEVGHALYEQGFRPEDERGPLAGAPSLGVHESQSRFWECILGLGRPFWRRYFPVIRQYFPGHFDDVDEETFWKAANRIKPGLIRTDADEVCYNLHIMVRFELEVLLMKGELPVEDIPAEWNRRYRDYLGVDVPHDGAGCLQDVHWSGGAFGYFPSYSFGNIYSAMLAEKLEEEIPSVWQDVEAGRFEVPLNWMREKIHRHGLRMEPATLIKHATGKEISSGALIRRLKKKVADVYEV